jgi:hypothetical protein
MSENNSFSIARNKYTAIFNRAFNSYLDLFLVSSYLSNKDLNISATIENFKFFYYEDKRNKQALNAYQLAKGTDEFNGQPINHLDKEIREWLLKNKSENKLDAYKEIFRNNKVLFISFDQFKDFYGPDIGHDRQCHFCHIKEKEIEELIRDGKILTKRLRTRGRKMEVDQRNPNEGYTNNNIALCCYWCNNAKTDEFSEEDFVPVGKEFEKIWRKRLNDNG